jgi:ABC-type transport system involved in multi-copper enzyme maturation permease subunit
MTYSSINSTASSDSINKPVRLQTWLIARQELLASFASKRGLFVSSLFVIIWLWLLFYPIRISAEAMNNPIGNSFILSVLNLLGLEPLKDWLLAEFAVYWAVALYIFPAFSLFMAADQMISERKRGGLRFLTLRCSRGQIFFGRYLGHILIQTGLLIITLAITYALLIINSPQYWLEGLQILPLLLLNLIVVTSPFVALMSLLSVLMNSVRMASLMSVIILVIAGVIINMLALYIPFLSVLHYLIPGMQVESMAQVSPNIALLSLWIPIVQSMIFLALGYGLFKRQAI